MTRPYKFALVAVLVAAVFTPVAARAPQSPTAPDLLKAVGTYLESYATKVSGTTLDELFLLVDMSNGSMQVPQRLSSDFVVVKVDASGRLVGIRDPYAVDKKNLRPHEPRVTDALEQPSLATWSAVQGYARENAIYLRVNGVVWFSDPLLALDFVATPNQSRMTYKVEGSKKINGVKVYALAYKETERPDGAYLLGTPDHARGSGRVWIDPETGAIHDTELWPESDVEFARVHVIYSMDPKRNVLLPHTLSGTFEEHERSSKSITSGVNAKATFEANLTYSNPRYVPIDLSKIAK